MTACRRLFAAVLVASLASGISQASSAPDERTFPVEAGDHLEIVVHGAENISTVLSGRFRVGADGSIHYPILGKVDVAGLNPEEITMLLRESISLHFPISPPLITVAEYAPVFLIGDVVRPGPFQFRPGMTVRELLLLSGGIAGGDAAAATRLSRQQQIRSLELTQFALQVRKARIAAEIEGTAFDRERFDEEARRLNAPGIVAAEVAVLWARQRAQDSRRHTYEARVAGYDQEIASIEESIVLHDEEVALLVEQLGIQTNLADRGLAVQSARRDVQRQLAASRREALEFRTALFQAKQNKLAAGQALTEVESRHEEDNVNELRDIEIALDQNAVTLQSEMAMLAHIPQAFDKTVDLAVQAPEYRLIREVNGESVGQIVSISENIQRGDIILVGYSTTEFLFNIYDKSDINIISYDSIQSDEY